MSHPANKLDDVVHQRTRLGILTVLAEAAEVDFGYLRQTLGLTDGNLSRHLQVLEEAGHVTITKGYQGKRPRTWVRISKSGRRALAAEISSLKALVQRVEHAGGSALPDGGPGPTAHARSAARSRRRS